MSENVTMENLPHTETSIEVESTVPVEKTILQSVIDNVVKQAKHYAYEQGKKTAKEELVQLTLQYFRDALSLMKPFTLISTTHQAARRRGFILYYKKMLKKISRCV